MSLITPRIVDTGRRGPKIIWLLEGKLGLQLFLLIRTIVIIGRSREARRLKENQIALRAAYLEHENNQLKMDLQDSKFYCSKLQIERDILKQKLFVYEDLFRK